MSLAAISVAGCGKKKDGGGDQAKAAGSADQTAGSAAAATDDKAAGSGSAAAATDDKAAGSGSAAAATDDKAAAAPPAPAGKCGAQPCPCKDGTATKSGMEAEGDDWNICELSAQTSIQGLDCAEGRVVFSDDGKLTECMLAADAKVDGYLCRGTPNSVSLYPSGKLKSCSSGENVEIGGYKIATYQSVDLHEDGTVRSVFLKGENRDIDGVPCTGGMRFFQGGKLQMCTLAADATIADNKLKAGTMVVWNDDGSVRGLWNEKPITWAKKKYDQKKRGNWLCFTDGAPDPEGFGCNSF
ncbi:MAG: hypothetical protein H6709_20525 [Kofleriaceae bacterium]|nr:hypothetical protein [Kofleriaceae bacterium]